MGGEISIDFDRSILGRPLSLATGQDTKSVLLISWLMLLGFYHINSKKRTRNTAVFYRRSSCKSPELPVVRPRRMRGRGGRR